jgi:hypothetical protein
MAHSHCHEPVDFELTPFQRLLLQRIDFMNTAVTDLQTAVANLKTVADSSVALLNQLNATIQAGGTINPADIEAQVTAINAMATSLGAAVTADTPAPAAPVSSDPAPSSAPSA